MYTNIPIDETLTIIYDFLSNHNHNTAYIQQLISLLSSALNQNYFSYNNKFFLQKDGLPMGSPLSSLISEISLQYHENHHIDQVKRQFNISYYGRYVDDILIIYDNINYISDTILNYFNNIHPKINYTIEKEHNNVINYLDLQLFKLNN